MLQEARTISSRREFIQAGLAVSILPAAAAAAETAEPAAPVSPFYKVIFDHRFPPSVEFGKEMEARGAALHGIHGDITDLWYHDLYYRWKKGPAPLTGMTAHAALFCLEQLAWNYGMRVLSRVEHPAADGAEPLITWTIGPKPAA